MKILFYGDSITDMGRNYNGDYNAFGYGYGYVNYLSCMLKGDDPNKYDIINRGISGTRVVDLYSRIKVDCWNQNPDLISILIGINDVWHEIFGQNGVELDRFEKVYRMIIEDTLKKLPNVKFILLEPFVLEGSATKDNLDQFLEVKKYASVVKKLASEYGLGFVPLQDKFDEYAKKYGAVNYLYDGVHPDIAGGKLIADEWLKVFNQMFNK